MTVTLTLGYKMGSFYHKSQ